MYEIREMLSVQTPYYLCCSWICLWDLPIGSLSQWNPTHDLRTLESVVTHRHQAILLSLPSCRDRWTTALTMVNYISKPRLRAYVKEPQANEEILIIFFKVKHYLQGWDWACEWKCLKKPEGSVGSCAAGVTGGSCRAGLTGGCEPPDVGAEKPAWVLCKSRACF